MSRVSNISEIAIIMGSKSDLPVVKRAIDILDGFEIKPVVRIISAHRTPKEAEAFASTAVDEGIKVIIAAAGKAAHLAGVLAASTPLPIIGLPIKSSTLDGLDSLLSVVQMPKGVPVATVAIDGAENAAILALQILSVSNTILQKKLILYKEKMAEEIKQVDLDLQESLG